MAVRETLELDLRSALAGLAQIDRTLASAAARFSTALAQALSQLDTKVEIDADTSGVTEAIDEAVTEVTVPVDADVDEAESEIASIEAPDVTVEVDADVSAAEEQIDQLGSTAKVAAKETSGLGGAVTGLQAAAGLAVGQTASLADGVAGISGKTAGAVGGVLALAASTKVLFDNALEAIGAEQRLSDSLGDLAGRVERINVGSLNEDLSTLAIKLGSSDDAIRDAVTNLFQMGTASGVAGDAAEETAEQIVALAARAVALNPALGDVGEVAETMGLRLARGGRFAAQFKIALTPQEIEDRARQMFNLSGEVGVYERVAAAAALATEKYGGSLKRDIEQGSKNPILQVRSLQTAMSEFIEDAGRPLVFPIIEAFREAVPAVEAFGRAIGQLVEAGLPLVIDALQVVTPILQVFADVIEALPDEIIQVAAALALLQFTAGKVFVALAAIKAVSDLTQIGLRAVFGGAEDLTDELDQLSSEAREVASLSDRELVPALDRLTATAKKSETTGLGPLTLRLRAFDAIAEASLGTAIRLADQIDHTSSEYKAMQAIIDRVAKAQQQQSKDSEVAAVRVAEEGTAFEKAAKAADIFKTKLDELVGVHVSALEAEISYKDGIAALTKQLQENRGNLDSNTEAGRRNISAVLDAADSARELADAAIREGKGVEDANRIMAQFTDTIRAQLIEAGNAPEAVEGLLQRMGLLGPQFNATGAELGRQLSLGLGAGITEQAWRAAAAATNAAIMADEAIKMALGITSPSKVFQDIGKQMVAGLALGMDPGPAVSASQRLAFATTSGFASGLRSATGGGMAGSSTTTTNVAHQGDTIVVQAPMPNPAAVGLEVTRVRRREQFLKGR